MPRLKASTTENQTTLPPLTDGEARACEKKFGVRFPTALVEILKEQNGGYWENPDFKLKGKDYNIEELFGLSSSEKIGTIEPLSSSLDTDFYDKGDLKDMRKAFGDLAKVLPFSGDGHYYYALDYNRTDKNGEPSIVYLELEGDFTSRPVAKSFSELLAGQYEGDAEPAVNLAEADTLTLIASGTYSGHRPPGRSPLEHSWKVCGAGDRIIILASENYGFGPTLERYEFRRSALELDTVSRDDIAEMLGNDFAELANLVPDSQLGPITQWAPDQEITPPCYELILSVDVHKKPVIHQSSVPSGGKWKNTSVEVVYAHIFSASKEELRKALDAVTRWKKK